MLPRVGNLLSRPCDSSESMNYFSLGFTISTSTPAYVSLSSWNSNWIDHQALDMNLEIGNPKSIWRQTPLDLTRDSHTQHKEQPLNVARVFPFILKAKHKTLQVKRAWAELKNSTKKQSAPRKSIPYQRVYRFDHRYDILRIPVNTGVPFRINCYFIL